MGAIHKRDERSVTRAYATSAGHSREEILRTISDRAGSHLQPLAGTAGAQGRAPGHEAGEVELGAEAVDVPGDDLLPVAARHLGLEAVDAVESHVAPLAHLGRFAP